MSEYQERMAYFKKIRKLNEEERIEKEIKAWREKKLQSKF